MPKAKIIYIAIGALVVLGGVYGIFLFTHTNQPSTPVTTESSSVADNTVSTAVTQSNTPTNTAPVTLPTVARKPKLFKIQDGPVVGASLVQTLHPTTTLARYIASDNGHAFDVVVESPGSVPRAVSNTTIPGIQNVLWSKNAGVAILQYINGTTIKTLSLGFAATSTDTTAATHMHFFPDDIVSIAFSPDGTRVMYLLHSASGIDGYVANKDGLASQKLFSLALSQVLVSWPSADTILLQTKSATGVPGMIFAVTSKTGSITTLVQGLGITATADPDFNYAVYQIADGGTFATYIRNIKTGGVIQLPINPFPERCVWANIIPRTLYCALPIDAVSPNYLDLLYMGTATGADSIISFNPSTGQPTLVVTPGGSAGGVAGTIDQLAVSPDDQYLSFTLRGTHSVWGVRVGQ